MPTECLNVTLSSKRRLEINVTQTAIELALTAQAILGREGETMLKTDRGKNAPFLIKNRTGYPLRLSAEGGEADTAWTDMATGADLPWRFEDWRYMREHIGASHKHNELAIEIDHGRAADKWDVVRHVSVDREGEQVFALKPKVDNVRHRLLCEIKLVDNVKTITIRSTFVVQNLTLVAVEVVAVDGRGKRATPVFKIAPGGECAIPIEAAYHHRIKVRPDGGLGYSWPETALHWQDFVKRPTRTILCRGQEPGSDFLFQAFGAHSKADPLIRTYPRLAVKLRPPIELENLLPYDLKFRLYDKNVRAHDGSIG